MGGGGEGSGGAQGRDSGAWDVLGSRRGGTVSSGWKTAERGSGVGGEYSDYGDDGSGEEAEWVNLPGED